MAGTTTPAMFALLLLGDGRFPTGGHAHSAGVEAAVADGRITDEATLEAFIRGRLATSGVTDAALAAATARLVRAADGPEGERAVLGRLDAEAHARLSSPPLRHASRRLGRQLTRVASRSWPDAVLVHCTAVHPDGPHLPVAIGATAVAAGLGPAEAATLSLHHAATTPAQAAVRLLGLDPFGVAALTARLAGAQEAALATALAAADGPVEDLPALGGPLVDLAAVDHRRWDVRMFAT